MHSEKHLQELSDKAFRYAILVVRNREDALDVMQETLYRYIVKKPEFENEKAETAWIYKVASNLSRNILMNSWYKKRTDLPGDLLESIYDKDSVETEGNSVINAVRRLPKKYSDVIYFYYYEEYPAEDICMILGIKESTFYSRLSRARKLLKRLLNSDDYDIYR